MNVDRRSVHTISIHDISSNALGIDGIERKKKKWLWIIVDLKLKKMFKEYLILLAHMVWVNIAREEH